MRNIIETTYKVYMELGFKNENYIRKLPLGEWGNRDDALKTYNEYSGYYQQRKMYELAPNLNRINMLFYVAETYDDFTVVEGLQYCDIANRKGIMG